QDVVYPGQIWAYVGIATLYGIAYTVFALSTGMWLFKSRELGGAEGESLKGRTRVHLVLMWHCRPRLCSTEGGNSSLGADLSWRGTWIAHNPPSPKCVSWAVLISTHSPGARPPLRLAPVPPVPTVPTFEQAFAFHQAGRLGEAEAAYRQIAVAQPAHTDA